MKYHNNPVTRQNSINKSKMTSMHMKEKMLDVGQVQKTYSDRMTCDITLLEGLQLYNVPILTRGGIIDEEKVYGEVDLPIEKDYVVIIFVGGRPIMLGTVLPFLNQLFSESGQTLAGPDSPDKVYTLRLLEKNKPKTYKRVFPSGATLEFSGDGSVYLETIDLGKFILHVDENDPDNSFVEWRSAEDSSQRFCRILMKATEEGILIEDTVNDTNMIRMNVDGIEVEDYHGNRVETRSNHIRVTDVNGNVIVMEGSHVLINGNLEILQ